MALSLSPDTQKLIEERMKRGGYATADEVVRTALGFLDVHTEELDEETLAAIEEGEAQLDGGEGRPWEELREQLRAKYLRK